MVVLFTCVIRCNSLLTVSVQWWFVCSVARYKISVNGLGFIWPIVFINNSLLSAISLRKILSIRIELSLYSFIIHLSVSMFLRKVFLFILYVFIVYLLYPNRDDERSPCIFRRLIWTLPHRFSFIQAGFPFFWWYSVYLNP